jgi:hypothetical protein
MPLTPISLVLVAVLNNPRDFEIARVLGWYRIPMHSAPKVVAVDYLAFYQTSAFGEEKWRIQYIAEVRGHELTTRIELLRDEGEHPHAHHEYFKIQLGPLEPLAQPIQAEKWRRITFFYTLGEHMLNARTIGDLIVSSGEREGLWKALRERAYQVQAPAVGDLPGLDLDPGVLAALLGIKELEEQYS